MIHHNTTQSGYHKQIILYIGVFLSIQSCQALAADLSPSSIQGKRFFTTQQERNKLDNTRLKLLSKDKNVSTKRIVKKKSRPVPAVQMRGFIKRSDGKTTTWLNQGNTLKSSTVDHVKVGKTPNTAGGVKVKLPDGKAITLKPGQRYDPLTGRIKSIY